MRNGWLAVFGALTLLVGCAASPEPAMTDVPLPPGAIKTGEGIYMVPIVKDAGRGTCSVALAIKKGR